MIISAGLQLCLLLLLFLPSQSLAFASPPGHRKNENPTALAASKNNHDDTTTITAEVVGAAGRIGSLFLTPTAKAIPKGNAPGCWSPPNSPIFVTTPAKAWPTILEDTLPHRRDDLVWIGNGVPPNNTKSNNSTVVVPHFGVLQIHADPVTSHISPPTFVYGKHAKAVERVLQDRGIRQVEIVERYEEILVQAAQKLLWASSMWLLCHDNNNSNDEEPLTALQAHTQKAQQLKTLVRDELVPALNQQLVQPVQADTALEYMHCYSKSMPTAIPSLLLAKEEWKERNVFFLKVRDTVPQPLHEALLERVGNISQTDIERAITRNTNDKEQNSNQQSTKVATEIPSLGLTL